MRVLLADDDEAVLLALELLLRREGMEVTRARSPVEVIARLEADGAHDALLLDLNYERDTTSGQEGFTLLSKLRRAHPALPVVVMTGWASIEGAVEAMRRGARDYVPKPWNNSKLVELLRGLSNDPPARPLEALRSAQEARHESPAMHSLRATIEQVAFTEVPILITGEHGSGKELVARWIHERSGRPGKFVALNAGALADGTFESELFGHVRGAFTDAKAAREGAFARAEDGTLFLDELANMPLAQQAKLLRVVQERQYQPLGGSALLPSTARIVSATNVDIDALARAGQFRADLLYRLNTIRLHVPPLRERLGELPGLVQLFLRREVERYSLPPPELDPGVLERLATHAWPGNVRELEHVIQRAVLLSARAGRLGIEHLDLPATAVAPAAAPESTLHAISDHRPETVREAEKAAILRALERFPDDRRAAAESLGLSRSAFYRRLSQHGIRPSK
ncbi:MAG TPA: sigma-54 dependent transcriptional regulator [Polyangiaceae bacterium]|nr:sigma-54 dependent transcriptional regulator [Polyangiaceae bacterium]